MTSPGLKLRLIAVVRVGVGEFLEVGDVAGGRRRVIPISDGVVDGPELFGVVVPLGADWNLVRADGTETVSAHYLIRTHDGVLLSVQNDGVIADRSSGRLGITALRIEAPRDSPYDWLNDAVLVGSLSVEEGEPGPTIILEYYCAEER